MAERNSPPLKDTGLPCPSILEGALGEGKKAEGFRRSGFLNVRPQISCIKVLREVVVGGPLEMQTPGIGPTSKKS